MIRPRVETDLETLEMSPRMSECLDAGDVLPGCFIEVKIELPVVFIVSGSQPRRVQLHWWSFAEK